MEIELGHYVRCKVTGFRGLVDHISYYPHQARRIGVTPDSLDKDGNAKDDRMFDEVVLEILKKPKLIDVKIPKPKFAFGQKVKDSMTGFKGKVTGHAFYINGCTRCCVQSEWNKKESKFDSGMWFPEGQLELDGKALLVEEKKIKTGGPSNSPSDFRSSSFR